MNKIKIIDYTGTQIAAIKQMICILRETGDFTDTEIVDIINLRYSFPVEAIQECL